MARISHALRRSLTLSAWAGTLLLFWLMSAWNLESSRNDAENRLISQAGHMAAQLAGLLSLPAWELDQITARTIVMAAMEDESIYAVNVETAAQGMLEGQRRNYQWEPVPWDDEIAENTVQGMSPLTMEGRVIGKVEVYLSPRIHEEEQSLMAAREHWRLAVEFCLSTGVLLFLFWQWGEMRLFYRFWRRKAAAGGKQDAESLEVCAIPTSEDTGCAADETPAPQSEDKPAKAAKSQPAPWRKFWPGRADTAATAAPATSIVDVAQGRAFLEQPTGWYVTAGLFRQTFETAPVLLHRLHATGSYAALRYVGQVLEQSAPCVGAAKLEAAARRLQEAIEADTAQCALAVEDCAAALEEVLSVLGQEA